ncbi:MAG: hypothetical protein JOY54_01010 [Acidobacteriaceae bacterium]|nr:hypothetical protein [Acidobacteriaceae bacterium]
MDRVKRAVLITDGYTGKPAATIEEVLRRTLLGLVARCARICFKADRAGAILAQRIAKAVVKTGAASGCWQHLPSFLGRPRSESLASPPATAIG